MIDVYHHHGGGEAVVVLANVSVNVVFSPHVVVVSETNVAVEATVASDVVVENVNVSVAFSPCAVAASKTAVVVMVAASDAAAASIYVQAN